MRESCVSDPDVNNKLKITIKKTSLCVLNLSQKNINKKTNWNLSDPLSRKRIRIKMKRIRNTAWIQICIFFLIYFRGFEVPNEGSSAQLLVWHEKVKRHEEFSKIKLFYLKKTSHVHTTRTFKYKSIDACLSHIISLKIK